ncbi:hypothetical protein DYQ86_14735 [Acidobacteria bacterium AB60]|nr:hypothetical protein DYQ86_14735 [Acidobacteria bacterium AB60]
MGEARLAIEIGTMKFSAEGTETWVDAKLEVFISQIRELGIQSSRPSKVNGNGGSTAEMPVDAVPLAIFLKEVSAGTSQNKRFLATAVWLKRQGQTNIQTASVVKALAEAQQQRLGNPADILNQNVKKGFCVKAGEGFYVTPEGEESLSST